MSRGFWPSLRARAGVRFSLLAVWAALGACGKRETPSATSGTLGAGEGVRVGNETVTLAELQAVATRQGISLTDARERLVRDALWAAGAASEPALRDTVEVVTRAALARAVIDDIDARAKALGSPSDAEVAELTAARWSILDRPVTVRVTHAVVRVQDDKDVKRAQAVAQKLASAVRDAADAKDFIARAEAVPSEGLEIRAERLPYMTLDGRSPAPKDKPEAPTRNFDADFARAAHALANPGDQSGLVRTQFGFHVIRLERRLDPIQPPLEERRNLLEADILANRGRRELDALLKDLRSREPIEFDRGHDSLTSRATAQ